MTTLTNIQNEQLFTDLKPEKASVIEGGAYFKTKVDFDNWQFSRPFYVRPGGNIFLSASTKNSSSSIRNLFYSVKVVNANTGNATSAKFLRVGNDSERWRGMRGGTYRLLFEDKGGEYDGNDVEGPILVSYDR
jgi:hypothetical protein